MHVAMCGFIILELYQWTSSICCFLAEVILGLQCLENAAAEFGRPNCLCYA